VCVRARAVPRPLFFALSARVQRPVSLSSRRTPRKPLLPHLLMHASIAGVCALSPESFASSTRGGVEGQSRDRRAFLSGEPKPLIICPCVQALQVCLRVLFPSRSHRQRGWGRAETGAFLLGEPKYTLLHLLMHAGIAGVVRRARAVPEHLCVHCQGRGGSGGAEQRLESVFWSRHSWGEGFWFCTCELLYTLRKLRSPNLPNRDIHHVISGDFT
jgi:hypothetical protein